MRPISGRAAYLAFRIRHHVEGKPAASRSRKSMNKVLDRYAVVFVAVAATLWASDAYFRNQLVQYLSPTQIVVAEDALVTLFLLPVLIRMRGELSKLGPGRMLAVGIIAAGLQEHGTILV